MGNISTLILEYVQTVPASWQLFLLFLSSFAEGLPVIGSVLPGGTIAIFSGSLVAQGLLPPVLTTVIVTIASFLGDMLGFFIGKRFKNARWLKRILNNEKHQKKWDLFDRHLAIISIFGKLIPVVRSTPSILAGVKGVRARRYIVYSFLGSLLWAIAGVYAGKIFTSYFGEKAIAFILGIIILSVTIIILRAALKKLILKRKI